MVFGNSVAAAPRWVLCGSFCLAVDDGSTKPQRSQRGTSGQNCLHHLPVDIGQTKVAPGVAISEFFVVEAEQMKNRGVQVMNVNRVLHRLETEFVGGAMHAPSSDAASSHPHRESI